MVQVKPTTQEIKNATGRWYKKAFWWLIGIGGLIGVSVLVICLVKRKGPISAAEEIAKRTGERIREVDANAKAEKAAAAGLEKKVVEAVKKAAMIEDPYDRAAELAMLALEDY